MVMLSAFLLSHTKEPGRAWKFGTAILLVYVIPVRIPGPWQKSDPSIKIKTDPPKYNRLKGNHAEI